MAQEAGVAGEAAQAVAYEVPGQETLSATVSARKVITTVDRTIKVKDVEEGYERAVKMAERAGGFVQSSYLEKGTEERERKAELVLRVPAANLDKVMAEAGELGEVLTTSREGEDVTEKWVDLESRIKNLKREEEALLEILGRRAKSLREVLDVERELARVRGEVERSEGRLRMLSEQVSLSTLHLTLVEREVAVEAMPAGLWAMKGTVSHAARSAMKAARAIVGLLIWVGILGIVWVPLLGIVLAIRYAVGRGRKAGLTTTGEVDAERSRGASG